MIFTEESTLMSKARKYYRRQFYGKEWPCGASKNCE